MRAAFINETGPVENLQVGDLPTPKLGAKQALVKVGAASINPIDTYIRAGGINMGIPLPYVVGCDLAGTVVEVGAEVTRFHAGDRVWGSNQGLFGRQGVCAEFAAVDEDWLYSTPEGVTDEDAAACALVAITAHLGLVQRAKLQAGECVFVPGGTGGVGSVVTQMAKAVGAKVLTTGSDDAKVAACLALGADRAINYKTDDLDTAIADFAPKGINVWWELRRAPDLERAVKTLAQRGRIIAMAGRDARPELPWGPLYVRDGSIHGFAMFNATPEEQRAAANDINHWLSQGKLKARIDRVLPLAQARDAHRLQEQNTIHNAGTLAGKIVLKP